MAASLGTFGPVVADVTNGVFAINAARNLASENGIKKTADLYKSGKTGKAVGNTALNLLDLSFIGHTGALLGRLGKTAYTTGKGLKNAYASDLVSRELSKNIRELKYIPGKVKYYGPTMGKTTAAKSNSSLVDFDDIVRQPSKDILNKYGFSSKYEMFESGNSDAIKEYKNMLISEMKKFKADPKNSGKTLVVSPSPVANPEKIGFKFDNTPSIPSKEEFIRRNMQRGGTKEASEDWWSNLIKENPNLRIDNRYISEIEQAVPNNHQLFRATVYKGGDIKDPQLAFFTTDPEYAKQYGVLNKYLLEQKGSPAIAKEPMMGSKDVAAQDIFIDRNTSPGQNIILGHDAITSDIPRRSKGIEIFSIRKPNILEQLTNTQNTFDANWKIPKEIRSISEAEKLEIPKGKRSIYSTPKTSQKALVLEKPILSDPGAMNRDISLEKFMDWRYMNGKANLDLWRKAGIDLSKYPKDLSEQLALLQQKRHTQLINSPNRITNIIDGNTIDSYYNGNRIGYVQLHDTNGGLGFRWIQRILPETKYYGELKLDPYTAIGTDAAKKYADLRGMKLIEGESLRSPKSTAPKIQEWFYTEPTIDTNGKPIAGKYTEQNPETFIRRWYYDKHNKPISEEELKFLLNKWNESSDLEMAAILDGEMEVSSLPKIFDIQGHYRSNLDPEYVEELDINGIYENGVPGFWRQFIIGNKKPISIPSVLRTKAIHPNMYENLDNPVDLGIFSRKKGGHLK